MHYVLSNEPKMNIVRIPKLYKGRLKMQSVLNLNNKLQ